MGHLPFKLGAIPPPPFLIVSSLESMKWRCDTPQKGYLSDTCVIPHANREKKSIHHHRGTLPFSVCRPTPRSQSKKIYGVYHFPGKTREKGIHHRSGKRGIHHRASDPEKEKKEGFHGGGVYFFLPAKKLRTLGESPKIGNGPKLLLGLCGSFKGQHD